MKSIIAAACAMALSGCAFSVYDLPVNYTYTSAVAAPSKTLPAIRVGDVSDTRGVKNPRMILNQTNGYNQTTTGGWQAEKNLSEIVRDAVAAGAAKYASAAPDGAKAILLSGELTDVTDEVISGFWTADLTMKVSVRFTATDETTGEILWRDTIIGEAKNQKGNANKMIVSAFSGAITDLVDKLYSDQYFRQQLTRAAPSGAPTS